MALEDDVELLMRVPLLASLGRDALRILAIGAEQRRLQPNETLFREGEDADAAYLVIAGAVTLKHMLDPKRGEVVVEVGALIGETALITEVRRPVTALARGEAHLLRIPAQHLPAYAGRLSGSRRQSAPDVRPAHGEDGLRTRRDPPALARPQAIASHRPVASRRTPRIE